MAHTSPGRGLLRSALALSSLALAAGCGDTKPETPLPPLVTLNIPEPNAVGRSLKLSVSVTGCDSVQTLTLLNAGTQLKGIPYAGGEAQVELAKNEVPYTNGIAASLSLSARAVCTDGRQSDSQTSAATFFPVDTVVEPTDDGQVVTDYFVADGSGANVTFLGCGNENPNLPTLYRVDATGKVLAQVRMKFICTAQTTITDPDPVTGTRWVWTPNAGVMAIQLPNRTTIQVTAEANPQLPLTSLVVDPDGHAIARTTNGNGRIVRLNRAGGLNRLEMWEYSDSGTPISEPVFRPDAGQMLLALHGPDADADGAVSILTLNYKNGPTVDGKPVSKHIVTYLYGLDPTRPAAAFNSDGRSLYLSFLTAGTQTLVRSCKTDGVLDNQGDMPCEGSNKLWESPPLQGDVVAMIPYANGARLAAIAERQAWFLDPTSGAVLNKSKIALAPSGALVVRQVQGGIPGSVNGGHEFYIVNGSQSTTQTTEIVAMDRAENGEVFRYTMGGGDLSMSLDAAGELWMRVNRKLVKALRLSDYRQAGPK
jgi:hypothetical protein